MAIEIALRCERHPDYVPKKARPRCGGCQAIFDLAGSAVEYASDTGKNAQIRARVYRVEVDPE